MSNAEISVSKLRAAASALVVFILIASVYWFFLYRESWPKGEALNTALQAFIEKQGTDQSLVAKAILDNYKETRSNTERWSAIYWGMTFVAAALSALAAVVLKFELILRSEPLKKDLAALFSVTAAVLITISTGGDFHRKWQANRIAAADLERVGYEMLGNGGTDPRAHFDEIARILHVRHVAISGSTEQRAQASIADEASPPDRSVSPVPKTPKPSSERDALKRIP